MLDLLDKDFKWGITNTLEKLKKTISKELKERRRTMLYQIISTKRNYLKKNITELVSTKTEKIYSLEGLNSRF